MFKFGSNKRRSSSQPPVQRGYNAAQGATSAAAIAFLTGRPEGGGENLSSSAAAAALRSTAATPVPIGEIPTKRMQRRGSTSSFGSNTGSVRQPFSSFGGGSVQRAPSRGSMTDRSFRSPSPGGRRRISSISSDVPPLPNHNRGGSLEEPYRVSSPEPGPGARSMSVDRASRAPAKRAAPRGGLTQVPEDRETEDLSSYRHSNINYSRPMSPTGSIRSVGSRPASASGYYYDPATRRLVGTPPAAGNTNSALKAARVSAQKAPPPQAYVPPVRQRPASVALASPAAKAAPTAAQLRAQHMRAGPPRTAIRAPPPQVRPGSSMGRMQSSAVSSTTSLASNKPSTNGTTAMNSTIASANKKRSSTLDSLSSPITAAARQSMQAAQASPASRPAPRAAPAPAPVYTSRAAPVYAPQPIKTTAPKQVAPTVTEPTSVPSPTHETLQSFHTRAAALLAGDATPYSPPAQSPQQNRSFSQPVSNLTPATNDVSRTASISPARSTRFSDAPLLGQDLHHEPLPRSVSPSKSAMKPSSIRTSSPSGSMRHGYSDNEDGSQTRKKKSVRISLAEPEAVPAQSRNVSAPLVQKGPWTVDDETNMGPRPALPTFGSVRGRKDVIKPGRAPQRPLSNVYETDMAPGHHEAPSALQHESASIAEGEVNSGAVSGLGLNGVAQQSAHAVEKEPETLSYVEHVAGQSSATTIAAPSIAVMPATPRAEEYLAEPSMVPTTTQAETPQQLPSIATHDAEEASSVAAQPEVQDREPIVDHNEALSAIPEAQKQMFLPDLVSNLRRPTSEMYEDRSFGHEDIPAMPSTVERDLHSNGHAAPAQATEHANNEAASSFYHNAADDYATKDAPYTTMTGFAGLPSALQHGQSGIALPSYADNTPAMPSSSTFTTHREHVPESLIEHAEAEPDFAQTPAHLSQSDHEPVSDRGVTTEHLASTHAVNLSHAPAITERSTTTEHLASPPHAANLSQIPAVSQAAAAHQVQVHDDDQPDDEDWDRVKSYWSSLSDTRKKQLEREAGIAPAAAMSPPADDSSLPAAPLPPWPDQQYQQSFSRATPPQSQMPMQDNIPRTLRGPDLGVGRPSSAQGPPGYGPPGYDRQTENSMPRTMRGPPPGVGRPTSAQGPQGPGRPPMENNMPRTMRGPEAGIARPQSAQGPPGSNRQPMYRNESSNGPNGPPMSNRPPMMRPGSSTGSLHGQPPLKSALKKTNAPIAIAPAAMQRTFSNSSDSDSSFRKERKRRRDAAGQASGGRMSMRRSMREDGPADRMMSPTPSNGGGRMSMRGSMREQNAPTLRSGGSGAMRASMRQSMDETRGGRGGGFAKPTKQQSTSQPNMFRSNRGNSSDEEDRPRMGGGGGGGFGGGFRSRFADSDDEEYAPPSMPQNKTFFGSKNNTPNGASHNERPSTNGQAQGAALGAGTLRIGEQTTPVKAKRMGGFMSSSKKQTSLDVGSPASAPVTPARPQPAGSLFRRLSSSQNTPQRQDYADYPPVPAMPDQYGGGPSGTAVDKKGLTAEQIAAQMWQKQQKTGKSALPIVSQKTGKKKKFQGLRRMLGIDD